MAQVQFYQHPIFRPDRGEAHRPVGLSRPTRPKSRGRVASLTGPAAVLLSRTAAEARAGSAAAPGLGKPVQPASAAVPLYPTAAKQ